MTNMTSRNDSFSSSSRKSTVDVPTTSLLDHSSTTTAPMAITSQSQRSISTSSASMVAARIVQSPQRMAESDHESIFLSSAGDVLVCRKQPQYNNNSHSHHAADNAMVKLDAAQCLDYCANGTVATSTSGKQQRLSSAAIVEDEDTMSTQLQAKSSLCSPWNRGDGGPGLLGGADGEIAGGEEDGIALIQSFDYSQFHEANEVPPETTEADDDDDDDGSKSTIFPNIPCFHNGFSSVPIATVSASRSHVLLIARDSGLLYAYGNNAYGQLGVGARHHTGISTPTIVTALAQGGGKVVACAAGTTHSLATVVRQQQDKSGSNRQQQSTSYYSYQVYGWGQTNVLGLVNPNKNKGDVATVLPRRVAKLQGPHAFLLQARGARSAAATAAVEGSVYTWGVGEQPMDHGGPPPSSRSAIQQLALTDARVYSRTSSGDCWSCCYSHHGYEWKRLSLSKIQRIHAATVSNVVTCCTTKGDVYRWNDAASSTTASAENNSPQHRTDAMSPTLPHPLCIVQKQQHHIVDVCGDWCVARDGCVYQRASEEQPEELLQPAYGGLRLWWSAANEA